MNNEDIAKDLLNSLSSEDMLNYKDSYDEIQNQKVTMFGLGGKLKLTINGKFHIEEMKLDDSVYETFSSSEITEGISSIFNRIINKIQTEQTKLTEELNSKIYNTYISKFTNGGNDNN